MSTTSYDLRTHPITSKLADAMTPTTGDVVIRDVTQSDPTGFLVMDAITKEVLGGPYDSLQAAALAARRLGRGVIWRETTDQRGRLMGPPFALPEI